MSSFSRTSYAVVDRAFEEEGTFTLPGGGGSFLFEQSSYSITNEEENGTVLTNLGITIRSGSQTTDQLAHAAETRSRSHSVSFTGGAESSSVFGGHLDNDTERTESYWLPRNSDCAGTLKQRRVVGLDVAQMPRT